MIMRLTLVALGGGVGALLRYLTVLLSSRVMPASFPYGILICNVLGSFVIGLLAGIFMLKPDLSPLWRLFVMVGVLGGFTTFSSFSLDTVGFLRSGEPMMAFSNIALSLFLCLLATYLGFRMAFQ